MTVWFCGAVFYSCWERGEKVGGFVEEGFCALGYELWPGTVVVGEDCWERDDGIGCRRWSAWCGDSGHDRARKYLLKKCLE